MKNLKHAVLAAILVFGGPMAAPSHGHEHAKTNSMTHDGETVTVEGAWAREAPPTAKNGAIYLTIVNHGKAPDRLVGVATAAAARAELHTHKNVDGVMRMRQIDSIAVPAGGSAVLKPGGDHVMLMGLTKPLKAGGHVMLTLTFASGQTKSLSVMVMKGGKMKKMKHTH